MNRKLIAALVVAAGIAGISNLVVVPQAAAERVFDTASMKWINVDTKKLNYNRKEPPKEFQRHVVSVVTNQPAGTIIVVTDKKYLYLVQGGGRAIRYGVGVGREGFTWSGTNLKIQNKQEWPDWHPPAEMIAREAAKGHKVGFMEGGEENPLGARAMYLFDGNRDTQYRIHGTNQPWSIGLNLSSGCFRMMNKDVEDLYDRVSVGTKVVVVGEGEDSSQYVSEAFNPLAYIPRPDFRGFGMFRRNTPVEKASLTKEKAGAKEKTRDGAKSSAQTVAQTTPKTSSTGEGKKLANNTTKRPFFVYYAWNTGKAGNTGKADKAGVKKTDAKTSKIADKSANKATMKVAAKTNVSSSAKIAAKTGDNGKAMKKTAKGKKEAQPQSTMARMQAIWKANVERVRQASTPKKAG